MRFGSVTHSSCHLTSRFSGRALTIGCWHFIPLRPAATGC
jgi:hypothetical protein